MTLVLALVLAVSAVSPKGAIATAHPAASEAGAEQLRRGGNAVDAAIAAAFALSVVEQFSSGIGGGGFALVWMAKEKKLHAIDFREVGPAAATKDMYLRNGKADSDLSLTGGLSIAVPGAVRGYAELVKRFGKRPLSKVVAPAIKLAQGGFRVSERWVNATGDRLEELAADPGARKVLLVADEDGDPDVAEPGDTLVQKDLARTLRAIGERGPDAFYKGAIARKLVAAVKARGGILTLEDLSNYKVRERTAIEGHYRGRRIVSFPPPSAGGAVLIGLLQTLEGLEPRAGGSYRPEKFLHGMIEAEKRLFAKREALFGDPDFFPKVNEAVKEMIDPAVAAKLRADIGDRATPADKVREQREHGTSHISVVDEEGNAVALTTTVNYVWGSCVMPPGTGVMMNDQMDDFDIAPGVPNVYGLLGGEANSVAAGKVPLSSMSPTIVFDAAGDVSLVAGAPGGSTIPTTVAQVISHVIDDGMPVDQAVAAPRIHHQLHPDEIRVENNGLEAATVEALKARGHTVRFTSPWGNAQAVGVDPKTGWRSAGSDPRGSGAGAIP